MLGSNDKYFKKLLQILNKLYLFSASMLPEITTFNVNNIRVFKIMVIIII